MKIDGGIIDLHLSRNGDISFSETIDGEFDFKSTLDDPLAVIGQTAIVRLTTHSNDWGNDTSNNIAFSSNFLEDGPMSLYRTMMDLSDLHGTSIDENTIGVIKDSIEAGLALGGAFENVKYEVKVYRMSASVFNVLLAIRVTREFMVQYLGIASGLADGASTHDFAEFLNSETSLLIITSQYDTSTDELSISTMDAREYMRGAAALAKGD